MKKYPENTRFTDYWLLGDNSIRRYVYLPDGKRLYERMPSKKFQHLKNDKTALTEFLMRVNSQNPSNNRRIINIQIRNAFISTELLDEYKRHLVSQIPTKSLAQSEFYCLNKYFLNFFINILNIQNPNDWWRNQTSWSESLLQKKTSIYSEQLWGGNEIPSAKQIKKVINAANRFMTWIHFKRPDEIKFQVFKPVTRAALKELDARRSVLGLKRDSIYISEKDWDEIINSSPIELKSILLLIYSYGLRRSEVLGLKLEDVRKGFLSLERQIDLINPGSGITYRPLKGRESRAIPHWFIPPQDCYNLISSIQPFICDKDTLSNRFTRLMKTLNMKYQLHDIRKTWVTKAIEIYTPDQVRKAAGHKDLNTTNKYVLNKGLRDESEMFIP